MIENLQSVNLFSPTISDIITNIVISIICSYFISVVYRFTYKGPGYSESFVNSIIFLSAITALVIMVIGNNLARAFGLVGAMSIIRFRTAVKDTLDIVYLFLSLAIGMAAGVGYHKVAIIGSILLGIVLIIFSADKGNLFSSAKYILQFSFNGSLFDDVNKKLNSLCRQSELISIKSNEQTKATDYTYYVMLKRKISGSDVISELHKVEGLNNINLFYDKENS
jgi:uncharacterized membrane protein YhiD involved in acid resistance